MIDIKALKALSSQTRLKIISLLLCRSYCVKALAAALNISQAAISQQLKILKDAKLIFGQRKGYFMHYEVDRCKLISLCRNLETLANNKKEYCSDKIYKNISRVYKAKTFRKNTLIKRNKI